jgi:hypothetical protein
MILKVAQVVPLPNRLKVASGSLDEMKLQVCAATRTVETICITGSGKLGIRCAAEELVQSAGGGVQVVQVMLGYYDHITSQPVQA